MWFYKIVGEAAACLPDPALHLCMYPQDGITPLMYAVKQGHYMSVRILFENRHADPNIQENVSLNHVKYSIEYRT